jgi:hypothetical protein
MYKFTIESVEQHVGYTYLIVDLQKICAKKNITCERERERERERALSNTSYNGCRSKSKPSQIFFSSFFISTYLLYIFYLNILSGY